MRITKSPITGKSFIAKYRIYSIIITALDAYQILDLDSGRLFEAGRLLNFLPFSSSVVCIFGNKTVNGNNKTRRCNKARFLQNTLKKTPSSGKSLISTYSFFWMAGGRG